MRRLFPLKNDTYLLWILASWDVAFLPPAIFRGCDHQHSDWTVMAHLHHHLHCCSSSRSLTTACATKPSRCANFPRRSDNRKYFCCNAIHFNRIHLLHRVCLASLFIASPMLVGCHLGLAHAPGDGRTLRPSSSTQTKAHLDSSSALVYIKCAL